MKKILPLILSTLLLTSCSGPDSSGGVEFSKTANEFPYGDCRGPGYRTDSTEELGCGYFVSQNANPETSYYIMPGANLYGANLMAANLSYANLSRANLEDTRFGYADLSGADLSGVNLEDASLSYANLSRTDLRGAKLGAPSGGPASLSGTNLSGADLRGAEVWRTYLGGANLTGADLRGADLNSVRADYRTICPNGKKWGTTGNNCGF